VPGSERLSVIQALAAELGLTRFAEVEAHAVREREPPARLVARLARGEDTRLTQRERQVLVLLASGLTRVEIADELGIAPETVKTHLARAYLRLGVHRQIDAINAFLEEQS
jgi:DNA-binding CsgD family transcriptional regulator